ncbi:MAG: YgiQ family radical SAM protein [Hyphomicrobiales bacterium]
MQKLYSGEIEVYTNNTLFTFALGKEIIELKAQEYKITDWLPTTKKEVEKRGWDELDVILISGDAYVDHPSFGHAVIGRIIEAEGFRVAIIPQPNWQDDLRDFKKLGRPRLFFGVTSGCMDSMVNHYTANKRLRSNDAYTPGGNAGFRPDHATIEYSKILKQLYPETPIVIGGVEASLRRFTHYDYWDNELKKSILADSGADILVYGMGELPLKALLQRLDKGEKIEEIRDIPQISYLINSEEKDQLKGEWNNHELNSHEQCLKDKKAFAANFRHIEEESNKVEAFRLFQQIGKQQIVVNPPFPPMETKEIDASFDLPYTRLPHPKYKKRGSIPAWEMIKHSVNIHRGCFGGCSFCTISAHQGKFVSSRSEKSILKEVKQVTEMEDFKGYLSDVGGPSANMYKMKGKFEEICKKCKRPSCIFPTVCKNLNTDHQPMIDLYKKIDKQKGIKKAFIGSGIRYDMLLSDKPEVTKQNHYDQYISQVAARHVSGRLKVAPEHTSDKVLEKMRKPSFNQFHVFKKKFERASNDAGLNQQIIPYFISSHPASQPQDMADLAVKTKDMGFRLEQVQDFTPTPMTLSTVIYYSGFDPYTLKPVYTATSKRDKLEQQKFFFWYKRENQGEIRRSLISMGKSEWVPKLLGQKNEEHSNKRKDNNAEGRYKKKGRTNSSRKRSRR